MQALPQESAGDLARIDGVTPRAAAIITAAVEFGRRTPGSPQSGARRTLHSAPTTESSLRIYIRRFFGGQFSVSPRGTVSFECRLTTPRTTPPSRPS